VGFQQTAQRIHRLLFDEGGETGAASAAAPVINFSDVRFSY
jgi:NitT/TauT family transport system ATP-binding protein